MKSIDDLMNNRRLLRFALTAHGMSDLNYAAAFVRRLLEGGIDDTQSLANRLSDQRYRDFVAAFNFKRYGATTTAFDRTQKGTADLYATQMLERNTGEVNEGARLALYFRRKVGGISSPLNILADAALLKVVQTATGLTPYMSNLNLDAQIQMISEKIDVSEFKDASKVEKFLNRFTTLWDLNNPTTTSLALGLGPLSFGRPTIGPDIIAAIQRTQTKL